MKLITIPVIDLLINSYPFSTPDCKNGSLKDYSLPKHRRYRDGNIRKKCIKC